MKRVAVVVFIAVINAVAFGLSGSATSAPAGSQDREAARQARIASEARRVAPGAAVRIVRMNGIREEGRFDRVTADAIEIIQISEGQRYTVTVALRDVKEFSLLKGTSLKKFATGAGITLAVLFGLCLASIGSSGIGG